MLVGDSVVNLHPVIIVGAGVIGLSTASLLQKKWPERPMIIIAAELPVESPMIKLWPNRDGTSPSPDYASLWAGAHYRPIPGADRQLQQETDFCLRTYKTMKDIAKTVPEAGVQIVKGTDYIETPTKEFTDLKTGEVFAGDKDSFRVLKMTELPLGVNWGQEYTTYCVNVHVYCLWLMNEFLRRGGEVIHKQLSTIEDAFLAVALVGTTLQPIVVNCSGRNLDNDPRIEVMRGQTVLVKNTYHQTVTRQHSDGQWTFLIPRPLGGGTIVGGTKEPGDSDTRVRSQTRQDILRRSVKYFPDFVNDMSKFNVVQDIVGLRPWRSGGLRIEVEHLGNDRHIVHGYGAGGRGYEMSWGIAESIVGLVDGIFTVKAKL